MAFPAADRTLIRSMRLGFLGPWPFRCENPADEGWISLDFLGFSRPNRDFSMGYGALSEETFFSALFPALRGAERECSVEAVRKRRLLMGQA